MNVEQIVADLRAAGCVFAETEAELLVAQFDGPALADAVARRVAGSPLEQILGWAEFRGLRIIVEPGVFVPRRRTEILVQQALLSSPSIAVDLCCGSGAVGRALAEVIDGLELHACDIDTASVRCARKNVEPVGGHAYEGDLYDALPQELRGSVDVIVANAPYVPTDAIASMPPEARDHEPRVALDGGVDGLDLHRRVAGGAGDWLAPGGRLLIETSVRQAERTAGILESSGFDASVVRSEELDGTAVIGTLSAHGEHGDPREHR